MKILYYKGLKLIHPLYVILQPALMNTTLYEQLHLLPVLFQIVSHRYNY